MARSTDTIFTRNKKEELFKIKHESDTGRLFALSVLIVSVMFLGLLYVV